MFVKSDEGKKFNLAKGIYSKILGNGGGLMVVENHFEKDAVAANHTHEHEQVGYVVKGRFEFFLDGEKRILEAGDSVYVKPNALHGGIAIEESIVIDVFTPQREDFLKRVE